MTRTWSLPIQNAIEVLRVRGYLLGDITDRVRQPDMPAEIHWTHLCLEDSPTECVRMPTGAGDFDKIVLIKGVNGPIILQPINESATYRYIAPIFPLKGRARNNDDDVHSFNAVMKLMFNFGRCYSIESESFDLV